MYYMKGRQRICKDLYIPIKRPRNAFAMWGCAYTINGLCWAFVILILMEVGE